MAQSPTIRMDAAILFPYRIQIAVTTGVITEFRQSPGATTMQVPFVVSGKPKSMAIRYSREAVQDIQREQSETLYRHDVRQVAAEALAVAQVCERLAILFGEIAQLSFLDHKPDPSLRNVLFRKSASEIGVNENNLRSLFNLQDASWLTIPSDFDFEVEEITLSSPLRKAGYFKRLMVGINVALQPLGVAVPQVSVPSIGQVYKIVETVVVLKEGAEIVIDLLSPDEVKKAEERIFNELRSDVENGRYYRLQERLIDLGYYRERPDSILGPQTKRAIEMFAKSRGIDSGLTANDDRLLRAVAQAISQRYLVKK